MVASKDMLANSAPEDRSAAAGVVAITQLWQYYHRPQLLNWECRQQQRLAISVLTALGTAARLAVWVLVKWKVARKAQE